MFGTDLVNNFFPGLFPGLFADLFLGLNQQIKNNYILHTNEKLQKMCKRINMSFYICCQLIQ